MFSIAHLLDRAKAGAGIETDYRLGKVIGISHQVISGYRAGKSMPSEKILEQICALSGDDPDVVAAQIQSERAQTPEAKNLWLRVAARISGGASTAILSVLVAIGLVAGSAGPARAGEVPSLKTASIHFLYIVSSTFLSVHCFALVRLRRISRLLPAISRLFVSVTL